MQQKEKYNNNNNKTEGKKNNKTRRSQSPGRCDSRSGASLARMQAAPQRSTAGTRGASCWEPFSSAEVLLQDCTNELLRPRTRSHSWSAHGGVSLTLHSACMQSEPAPAGPAPLLLLCRSINIIFLMRASFFPPPIAGGTGCAPDHRPAE